MADKKKKVVVTTKKKSQADKIIASTAAARRGRSGSEGVLIFNKENYKWVLIGIALITLGMLLMMGGFNVDPNVFDESELYSLRRTLLAPICILAGLAVEVYAIFK
ncbi:DUF3098 domain-containing protein [Saprospiraceae bacterium]|nr:DUF3098 domain-containing protein [Saprospiraceae bacterium]